MEKYCRAGQTTYDSITRRMRIACWITNAVNPNSEFVIDTFFFHANNGYANAPECCFICKLLLLLNRKPGGA